MASLRNFVKENREEITKVVKEICPNCGTSLADLEEWVSAGDEGLYNWARREGWPG